jgi:precorrin-3B methylase
MTDQREFVQIDNERGQTRNYETIASRLMRFREAHPDWTIRTEILDCTDEVVRVHASIGYISEGGIFVALSSGHAEEYRETEGVNATSALENCETSAIGRALSFVGFGSPDSIASAEEVIAAKRKEKVIQEAKPGALVLLQEAAKKGSASLQDAWETSLSKEDRQACRGYLAKLKRQAAEVDVSKKTYQRESGG